MQTGYWPGRKTILATTVVWLGYGLLFFNQNLLLFATFGTAIPDVAMFALRQLLPSVGWAIVTPLLFYLSNRFPVRGVRRYHHLLVHLLALTAMALLDAGFDRGVAAITGQPETFSFAVSVSRQINVNVLLYAAVAGTAHMLAQLRLSRDQALRLAQLETQLAVAQVDALRMQIQPHFLFNTLNAISQLFHEDPDRAERMMARLGDLLRSTLEMGARHEVTLADEVEFVRGYVEIQHERFGDRLHVRIDADPDSLALLVPSMILQPIVENAIRHGVEPTERPGNVGVSARRTADALIVTITDNGPGFQNPRKDGIGMANIKARLLQLYGGAASLHVESEPGRGSTVRITIPVKEGSA